MTATPLTVARHVRPRHLIAERPARVGPSIASRLDADTRAALERVAAMDSHELTLSAFDSLLASV